VPKHQTVREARERSLSGKYAPPELGFLSQSVKSLRGLEAELEEYWNILLLRQPYPIDNGVLSLMETAVAIYTRCCEITAALQEAEYNGSVPKGSHFYKFRTGPLRSLTEASSRCIDMGSRRITVWVAEQEQMREIP
jgi:hypothetical protein